MSGRILLIDGYNLLYAAGLGQVDYRPGDLLRCRNQLLRLLLDRLSHSEIRDATLVFDARDPPPDRPAELRIGGLRIQFANPGGDADALIRNWLARHPTPRRVTLISSDRELQRAARGAGAKFVDSQTFLEKLQQRQPEVRRGSPGQGRVPEDDDKPGLLPGEAQSAEWLRYFGDLSGILAAADEPLPPAPAPQPSGTAPAGAANPAEAGEAVRPRQRTGRQRTDRGEKDVPRVRGSDEAGEPDLAELEHWLQACQQELADESLESPERQRQRELEQWLAEELKRPPGDARR